jgi:hypothetical protein
LQKEGLPISHAARRPIAKERLVDLHACLCGVAAKVCPQGGDDCRETSAASSPSGFSRKRQTKVLAVA